jgi:hypothetical protein
MPVQRTCEQCGAGFTAKPVHVAEGNARYCSVPCYRLGRRRRVSRVCRWCGRDFEIPLCWADQGRGIWCSYQCRFAECRETPSPLMSAEVRADRLRAKFEAAVSRGRDPDRDCWSLAGDRDSYGYALLASSGYRQSLKGHRVAYQLYTGPIPLGMVVRHTCDRPACVNPAHLLLGTQTDNNRDKVERGRQARGERQGLARATEDVVRDLRRRYDAGGVTVYRLAAGSGLSTGAVYGIVKRQTWRHVP